MAQQKTALIVGMAKSGIAAARLLYENGYRVIINDMKPEIKGPSVNPMPMPSAR